MPFVVLVGVAVGCWGVGLLVGGSVLVGVAVGCWGVGVLVTGAVFVGAVVGIVVDGVVAVAVAVCTGVSTMQVLPL